MCLRPRREAEEQSDVQADKDPEEIRYGRLIIIITHNNPYPRRSPSPPFLCISKVSLLTAHGESWHVSFSQKDLSVFFRCHYVVCVCAYARVCVRMRGYVCVCVWPRRAAIALLTVPDPFLGSPRCSPETVFCFTLKCTHRTTCSTSQYTYWYFFFVRFLLVWTTVFLLAPGTAGTEGTHWPAGPSGELQIAGCGTVRWVCVWLYRQCKYRPADSQSFSTMESSFDKDSVVRMTRSICISSCVWFVGEEIDDIWIKILTNI